MGKKIANQPGYELVKNDDGKRYWTPVGGVESKSKSERALALVPQPTGFDVKEFSGKKDNCPKCGSSFQGAEISAEHRESYGGKTHFSTDIVIEVPGVYDGGLLFLCPYCNHQWPRFTEGRLNDAAITHITSATSQSTLCSAVTSPEGLRTYAEANSEQFLDWYDTNYGGQIMAQDIADLPEEVFYGYLFDKSSDRLHEQRIINWARKNPHVATAVGDNEFFDRWAYGYAESSVDASGVDDEVITDLVEAVMVDMTPSEVAEWAGIQDSETIDRQGREILAQSIVDEIVQEDDYVAARTRVKGIADTWLERLPLTEKMELVWQEYVGE